MFHSLHTPSARSHLMHAWEAWGSLNFWGDSGRSDQRKIWSEKYCVTRSHLLRLERSSVLRLSIFRCGDEDLRASLSDFGTVDV